MSTNNHTPITTGAAVNASVVNSPISELDSAIGNKASLTTTVKTSLVGAVNELDAQIGAAASVSGSIGSSIDTDGTLKSGAVDVTAVLADGIISADKMIDGAIPSGNLVFDPINRYYSPSSSAQDGNVRWYNSANMTKITDASNPFSQNTIRLTAAAGKRTYLAEMGLKIGDVVSAGILVKVPTGTSIQLNITSRTSAGALIAAVSSSTVVGNDTTVFVTKSGYTLPATCTIVDVWVSYISGSGNVDVYGWYLFRGDKAFASIATDGVGDGQRAMQQINATYGSGETSLVERFQRATRDLTQDPFARMYAPTSTNTALQDGGRLRWYNGSTITRLLSDASNPFNTPTLRITPNAGRRLWLDELGLTTGDIVSIGAFVRVAVGNTYSINYTFRTSGAALVTNGSGTATAGDGNVQFHSKVALTVPATAAVLDVWFSRSVGTGTIDVYGMFVYPGSTINQAECLSLGYSQRYNPGGWLMRKNVTPSRVQSELLSWKNIQARVALAQSGKYGRIMCIGDSITNTSYRYYKPLLERVQNNLGAGSAGIGFLSTNSAAWTFGSSGAMDKFTSISRSGSWVDHTAATTPAGVGPDLYDAQSGAAADTYTIVGVFTDARILYAKQTGGGTFKYRIDGGAWSADISTNAADAFAAEVITGQTPISHTLEVYANGATVKLLGFELYDTGLNGFTGHKLGYSGGTTTHWVTASSSAIWQGAIAGLAPDLIVIWLGTNDRNGAVTDATFKANMLTLITALRSILPNVSILLVSPYIDGLGYASKQDHTSYRDRIFELAQEVSSCVAVDMGQHINYTLGNALSLFEDTTHINLYGGQIAAEAIYQALSMARRNLSTQRAKRHVSLPLAELGAGGSAPTLTRLGNTAGYAFAIGDDGYIAIEVPPDWDPSTDIRITAHVYTNEAYATRNAEIRFQADWSSISINAHTPVDAPVRSGTLTGSDLNIDTTAKGMQEYDFGYIPAASIVANDSLFVKISRIALAGGTNPVAEPVIIFMEYEYISNSLGYTTP